MQQPSVNYSFVRGGVKRSADFRFSGVLLGVSFLVSLFLFGCGQKSDTAIRFEMEKMMSKADRLRRELSMKGASLSEDDLYTLVEAYRAISLKTAAPQDSLEVAAASDAEKETWALASLANTRIGVLYLDHKIYDEAIHHFEIVINNPATSDLQKNAVMNYMAVTKEKAKQFLEAAAFYDSLASGYRKIAVPETPNLDALGAPFKAAEMWLLAGDRRGFNERMDRARAYYRSLIREFPDSPLESAAIGKLAASYIRQSRFAEAVEVLESTRDEDTGLLSPTILMRIADIYMNNLRDFAKAGQTYREFISYYPSEGQIGSAYLGLGLSLFQRRKFTESRETVGNIEKLPRVDQKTVLEANYLIALCYDNEGKWELSKGHLDYIQGSFPGTDKAFEAALYIANRYRSKGQTELARRAYDDAEEYISRYADQAGANSASVSRAMGYLVRCYIDQEDYDRAAQTLMQLYQSFPQLPEGRLAPLKLADLYENAIFDTAKAIHWLKTYVDSNPENDNLEAIKERIQRLEAVTEE
jgi:TolA-binding protein